MMVYIRPTNQGDWQRLVTRGFQAHGWTVTSNRADLSKCELICFWGHRAKELMSKSRQLGVRYLVMEMSYLGDRNKWLSLGFDGLNGYADFNNRSVSSDRADIYWSDSLRPWSPDGDYALVVGQVRRDASIEHIDVDRWLINARDAMSKRFGKVLFRQHPLDNMETTIPGVEIIRGSLSDAISGSAVVVTMNSNAGVDAILAGKPVIATDEGSMVRDVAAKGFYDKIIMPDRQEWLNRLSYCQWLPDEVESGEAWEHLKSALRGRNEITDNDHLNG